MLFYTLTVNIYHSIVWQIAYEGILTTGSKSNLMAACELFTEHNWLQLITLYITTTMRSMQSSLWSELVESYGRGLEKNAQI